MQKQTLRNKVLKIAVATTLATVMSWMYVSPALANNTNTRYKSTRSVAQKKEASHYHSQRLIADKHARHGSTNVNHVNRGSTKQVSHATKADPSLTVAKGADATPILISTRTAVAADSTVTKDTQVAANATPAVAPAKSEFVQQMLSNTNAVNGEILRERARMLSLQSKYDEGKILSDSDQAWVIDLANRYHVANPDLQNPQTWTQLTQKVDVIPASLVIGQSIQESGWGASSIAKRAHNYFGQMCGGRSGCFPGTRYQSFTSMRAAVTAYIHNLNSNGAYQALRSLRFQARSADQMPNSIVLANGLNAYSTLRGQYISSIKNVITTLHLRQYDSTFA